MRSGLSVCVFVLHGVSFNAGALEDDISPFSVDVCATWSRF